MNLAAILAVGFFLGMRHATDGDHVVAVSSIISRERTLRAAAPIGILWGVGHTITIFLVGGSIILFGIVIPPHVGLGMDLSVALMLVLLGALNVRAVLHDATTLGRAQQHHDDSTGSRQHDAGTNAPSTPLRPLFVGIVHGLAGSAAVALIVLGAIRDAHWGLAYLVVFGAGTIAGMLLITTALALPIAAAAQRFERFHRTLGVATGLASVAFGAVLVYEIGFVHGLFTGHPQWIPQ